MRGNFGGFFAQHKTCYSSVDMGYCLCMKDLKVQPAASMGPVRRKETSEDRDKREMSGWDKFMVK